MTPIVSHGRSKFDWWMEERRRKAHSKSVRDRYQVYFDPHEYAYDTLGNYKKKVFFSDSIGKDGRFYAGPDGNIYYDKYYRWYSGFVIVIRIDICISQSLPNTGTITFFEVGESSRHHRLATQALLCVLKECPEIHYAEVYRHNDVLMHLYKAHGFRSPAKQGLFKPNPIILERKAD